MNVYLLAVGISLSMERFSASKGTLASVQKGRDHGVGHGLCFFVVSVRNAMTEVFIFFLRGHVPTTLDLAGDRKKIESWACAGGEPAKDHILH